MHYYWYGPSYRYYCSWRRCFPWSYGFLRSFYGLYGSYPARFSTAWWLRPATYFDAYDPWDPYQRVATYFDTSVQPRCEIDAVDAWLLLYADRYDDARTAFSCLVTEEDRDGLRWLGLSLAAGASGEQQEAVDAARVAMEVEPEAITYVRGDPRLIRLFGTLLEPFQDRAINTYGDVDALFMVATMRYLRGEHAAARYTLEVAITLGDDTPSTAALLTIVDEPAR